jgi:hypothetical protein
MSGGRKAATERTVDGRAMAILTTFVSTRPALGASTSTVGPGCRVFRLVGELCEGGEREDDLRYRVGPRLTKFAELRDDGGSTSHFGRPPVTAGPANRLRSDT